MNESFGSDVTFERLTTEETIPANSTYKSRELFDTSWQAVVITLYTFTAVLALLGNVIAIWVLVQGKRSRELRAYLVNLSLTDVTMATFSIPFTYTNYVLGRWVFYPSFCPLVQMMQVMSVFVSIYTLTAIGVDRYIAIMFPLLSARLNRSSGRLVLGIIWLCGIGLGVLQWANTAALPLVIENEPNTYCKETWESKTAERNYTLSLFFLTFAFPLGLLTFAYGSLSWKMARHSTPGNVDVERDRTQNKSKSKIIKMLCTIVVLFAICWLPIHILNILITCASETMENIYNDPVGHTVYVVLSIAAHWLSMANSFMNPIIYCFMSGNFRSDLRFLLRRARRRWFPCCPEHMLHRRNKNSMVLTMRSSQCTYRTSVALSSKTTNSSNSSRTNTSNKVATNNNINLNNHNNSSANGHRQGATGRIHERQCSALSSGSGTDREDQTLSVSGVRTETRHSGHTFARGDTSEWSEETHCTTASATPSTTHSLSGVQPSKISATRRASSQSTHICNGNARADHSRLNAKPSLHLELHDLLPHTDCEPNTSTNTACRTSSLTSLVDSHSMPHS